MKFRIMLLAACFVILIGHFVELIRAGFFWKITSGSYFGALAMILVMTGLFLSIRLLKKEKNKN